MGKMPGDKHRLKTAEISKRKLLNMEKPYVYEKIMRYDEKVKRGESIAILQFNMITPAISNVSTVL